MSTIDTEAIEQAVVACSGVVGLSGGPAGTVATYLPGRRVTGVRVVGSSVEIHVVARWDVQIPSLAEQVRARVAPLVGGYTTEVVVEDLSDPVSQDRHERGA
jgi:uncharacterized alkaline shock family protein YloU